MVNGIEFVYVSLVEIQDIGYCDVDINYLQFFGSFGDMWCYFCIFYWFWCFCFEYLMVVDIKQWQDGDGQYD